MAEPGAQPLAFEQVYRLHAPRVYHYCLAQLGDPALAEDIAGEVFVRALSAYDAAQPAPDTVQFWLFRIAKNLAVDHRRRARLWERFVTHERRELPSSASVERSVLDRDEVRRVFAALGSLRGRDRTLVSLRIGGRLSYAEIGEIVGMTEGAATVAIRRALQKVRLAAEGQS